MAALFLFILACLSIANGQVVDLTRQPNAAGPEVVEAVVSLIRESCIFDDDRLFLRRLAFVESKDGTDAKTYRPGYYGGIWQVDQDKFLMTKNNPTLSSLYADIYTRYGIQWGNVQWQDLTKPLYSGLAAALYVAVVEGVQGVPRRREDQAAFYLTNFRPNDQNSAYNFNKESQNLEAGCSRSNLDLVFVVDSSSSLAPSDFERAKTFASDVVDKFTVGPNDVRVAFLTFSTGFQAHFFLNQYSDKAAVQTAIKAVLKKEGGTDTDLALDYVANEVLSPNRGSRVGVSKVVVLVTDGQSTDKLKTRQAAERLRDKGVNVFAIGVGDQVDVGELSDVASAPNCTHAVVLSQYSDLDSLVFTMQQVSCRAPTVLGTGAYNYPCTDSNIFQIPANGTVITTIDVTDGTVDIYGSFLNPRPNKAFSEFNAASVPTMSTIVFLNNENRPLYVNVTPSTCRGSYNVGVQGRTSIPPGGNVICVDKGVARSCTVLDLLNSMYTGGQFSSLGVPSPCVAGQPGYFPYIYGNDRFIYCNNVGMPYLFYCPAHTHYDPRTYFCIPGEPTIFTLPPVTTKRPTNPPITFPPVTYPPVTFPPITQRPYTPQPTIIGNNPCTEQNILNNLFFFPYPPDETKYIECTEWPLVGYIKNCPPNKKWDQADLACVYRPVVVDPTKGIYDLNANNPCKRGLTDNDIFHYPFPPDRHKFIQCDQFGDAFIKDCLPGRVWNQKLQTCVPENALYTDTQGVVGK